MNKVVLDASALLAVLQLEAGGDIVADKLDHAHMSASNLTEVVTKLIDHGHTLASTRRMLAQLVIKIEDIDEAMAYAAAAMRPATKRAGLSLGDRLCLALGAKLGAPVLTTDKKWGQLDLGIDVTVVR